MNPFFSVIIPTYNRSLFLKKAVDSVIAQDFENFELIIIDDGSSDNTCDLVKSYKDKRLKYVRQENKGPSYARNRGINQANALWLCFLDSDDWWDREKLKITRKYINKYPDCKIFHTEEIWYRGGKLLNQKKTHKKYGGWIFDKCLPLCRVSISTACIHKSVFKDVGLFDEGLPCCEDYELWLRISLKHPICLIPKALTLKEGGHPDQVSKKFWGMDRFRIQAMDKILKNHKLSPRQYKICFEELEKKCNVMIGGCLKRKKTKEAEFYLKLIEEHKKRIKQETYYKNIKT